MIKSTFIEGKKLSTRHYPEKKGRINLRLKEEDHKLLKDAARIAGYPTLTQFVRECIMDAVNRVIDEHDK